jgi:Fructosamine kinase
LAQLHRDSVSPEGKFGFHTQTYNGNIPQDVRWTDTWEECFVNGTKMDFELEREARGASENLDALIGPLFEKVIPRLLRPLETGCRKLKPCFVHGDLWYGNGWYIILLLLMHCLIDCCLTKPRTTQPLGNQCCLMPQASTATMNVSDKQTGGYSRSHVVNIRLTIAGKSTSRQCG